MKWVNAAVMMPSFFDIKGVVFRRVDNKVTVSKHYYDGRSHEHGIFFTDIGSDERIPLENIEWLDEISDYVHFFGFPKKISYDPIPGISKRLFMVLKLARIMPPPSRRMNFIYEEWCEEIFKMADDLLEKNQRDEYLEEE
ncbi:MAG: hypothetical protein R2824_06105 [Saprospiraceae bacterium]|nr:hypothetical protein [Lewinella sp.]